MKNNEEALWNVTEKWCFKELFLNKRKKSIKIYFRVFAEDCKIYPKVLEWLSNYSKIERIKNNEKSTNFIYCYSLL